MAGDLIGELGLDTKDFESALDRVGSKLETKFGGAIKRVGTALLGGLGVGAVARYLYSLRNLSGEIDSVRAKMVAGSQDAKDFDKSLAGSGGASLYFQRLGLQLDLLKLKAKNATGESIRGLQLALEDYGNKFSTSKLGRALGLGKVVNKVRPEIKQDEETDRMKKELLASEDDLAKTRELSVGTLNDEQVILEAELRIEKQRLAIAERMGMTGREEANAARAAVGELNKRLITMKLIAVEQQMEKDRLDAFALDRLKGDSRSSKESEIRFQFEEKIIKAYREGNFQQAENLKLQRDLTLEQAKVDFHNKTPRQLANERKAGRKFNRDLRHQEDRDRELERREGRGVHGRQIDEKNERKKREDAANAREADVRNLSRSVITEANSKASLQALRAIQKNTEDGGKNK